MPEFVAPFPGGCAMAVYEAREASAPYVPPEPAFRLFPPDVLNELRELVLAKRAERAAAAAAVAAFSGEDPAGAEFERDQIEHRRLAREVDRRFRSHGPVAAGRSASTASPSSGAGLTGPASPPLARPGAAPGSRLALRRAPPRPVEQPSLGFAVSQNPLPFES